MPTIDELAIELRHKGPERLLEEHPASSVLIGLGILGIASERSERSRNGTIRFTVEDHKEYLQAVALVGRVWFLVKKRENRQSPRIVIGRTSDADVVIPELSISVTHCALEATPFGLQVSDLNSTNGTYVNGQRLPKNTAASLNSGMKLALGRFEFEYLRHQDFMERLRQIALKPAVNRRSPK